MGGEGGPVLGVLGAVLAAHRQAQHHRHFKHSGTHGLPFGQLVEHLVPGAAQEVAVHELCHHPAACHGIAHGGAHNAGFRNGGVEQAVIGQGFRHAAVDGKGAAPVAHILAKGDQGGVLIELVDDGLGDAVPQLIDPVFADGLAVLVQAKALLFGDLLNPGAFLTGQQHLGLSALVKGADGAV